jgi:hypothetical protein
MKRYTSLFFVLALILLAWSQIAWGQGEKDQIVLKMGTAIVTDHPFFAVVEQYNSENPDVEVILDIAPWSGDVWAALGTGLAAGNPPDIMRVSISGMGGQGALQSPLLIDVKPLLTDEEVADYGPGILNAVDIGDRYVLWPQDRDWGAGPVGNAKLFADAGVDLEKIRADGWTFDEFRDACRKMTNESEGVYGFTLAAPNLAGLFAELAHRAGAPDGSGNNGFQMWGNEWLVRGEPALKAAQLIHDLIYVDKCVPEEITGITDHMQLYYAGKAAIVPFWHGIVGAIEAYNNGVETGDIVGEKADFDPLVLPYPYDPDTGSNGNVARTTGLALFRQDPYKGDEHTQNVVDFVRWLTSPTNLAIYANWEGTIPAKESAYPEATQLSNPEIVHWAEWGSTHAWVQSWPIGHPVNVFSTLGAAMTSLANNELTPAEAVAQVIADVEEMLANWVAENPDLAEEWATPPPGWPDNYLTTLGELESM